MRSLNQVQFKETKEIILRMTQLKFVILVNFTTASPVPGFSPSVVGSVPFYLHRWSIKLIQWSGRIVDSAQECKWSGSHCCPTLCWNGERKGSRRHEDVPCVTKMSHRPWDFSSLCGSGSYWRGARQTILVMAILAEELSLLFCICPYERSKKGFR